MLIRISSVLSGLDFLKSTFYLNFFIEFLVGYTLAVMTAETLEAENMDEKFEEFFSIVTKEAKDKKIRRSLFT